MPFLVIDVQINLHTFNLLFSETVKYCQDRVDGVAELEERCDSWLDFYLLTPIRLACLGRQVGIRFFQLHWLREKAYKLENRIVPMLHFLQTVIWKEMTGRPADSLEKSTDRDNECKSALLACMFTVRYDN